MLRGIARFEERTRDLGLEDFEKLIKSKSLSDSDRFTVLFYYSKLLFTGGDLEASLNIAINAYDIDSQNIALLQHRGNLYRLLNISKPGVNIKKYMYVNRI